MTVISIFPPLVNNIHGKKEEKEVKEDEMRKKKEENE